MYFFLYRTTCLQTGKIYFGVHKTKRLNDTYLGSGSLLLEDIKKYGKKHFRRDVVMLFDNEKQMFEFEQSIVNESFLKRQDVYNLRSGGLGSHEDMDYINMSRIARRRPKGNGNNQLGMIWIWHPEKEERTKIYPSHLEDFLAKGWIRGKQPPKPKKYGSLHRHLTLLKWLLSLNEDTIASKEVSQRLGYWQKSDFLIGIRTAIKKNNIPLLLQKQQGWNYLVKKLDD